MMGNAGKFGEFVSVNLAIQMKMVQIFVRTCEPASGQARNAWGSLAENLPQTSALAERQDSLSETTAVPIWKGLASVRCNRFRFSGIRLEQTAPPIGNSISTLMRSAWK
jgi:hypothetical protein